MPIADVTVIPIGTEGPSVSRYVADIQRILAKHQEAGAIRFQLTPMNTIIEGDLPVIFQVIQEIHNAPYNHGIQRVATSIRIDDRRDKISTMEKKLESVQEQLKE
ncbi:MTH1187 family thiamine-binding protein [Peribacillus sp. SCS-155]|uniref:MTH1187 family thiamine-binding protein n=1 Tax=Peribacillus sedimenti TaxID=3115297 RepID=UPI0039059F9F